MAIPNTIEGREYTAFTECNGKTAKRVKICQESGESIAVEFQESGISINFNNEILALAGLSSADALLYVVPVGKKLKIKSITCSGENKAEYTIKFDGINQSKQRTSYINFNCIFEFDLIELSSGTIVKVNVNNGSNSVSNFNANLQGKLLDA